MKASFKVLLALSVTLLGQQALAQVTLYEAEGFRGRAFTANRKVEDLTRFGFNDRASSVVVENGRWEVCEHARYGGQCAVLRPGSYNSLSSLGLNDRVSSLRRADDRRNYTNERPPPMAEPDYAYRRRPTERVYEARVNSVRAVMGAEGKHCWVERQRVVEDGRGSRNVGGGVLGAIIGGVIGHQIGSGTGRDVATVGGVAAGAAIGSNQNRADTRTVDRDVQHCEAANGSERPEYWDVTYDYRGVRHYVQMSEAPGDTIFVNANGEPRQ